MKTLSPRVRTHADRERLAYLFWLMNRAYCRLMHGFTWQGPDPLPADGPAILVCNHLSSVDPFILSACTRRVLSFLIAREFFDIPGPRFFFRRMGYVPVRRDRQDVGAVRKSLQALQRGQVLCVFPEGGIDRGFQAPHLGASYLSLRSGVPVIPARVIGTPMLDSVWKALMTRSVSNALFGAACIPPKPRDRRPTRTQVAEWNTSVTEAILALEA